MKANRIEHYRRIHPWENFFLDSALYSVGQALGIAYEEGIMPVAAVTGDLFAYLYSREKYCDSGLTNSFFRQESVEEVYAMYGICLPLSLPGRDPCRFRRGNGS